MKVLNKSLKNIRLPAILSRRPVLFDRIVFYTLAALAVLMKKSLFDLASLTKIFTTTIILKLVGTKSKIWRHYRYLSE